MWILDAKLPDSDLNFAVIFGWIFLHFFFPRARPEKSTENPPQNSPGNLFGKIPLGFLQKPSLDMLHTCGVRIFKKVDTKVFSF